MSDQWNYEPAHDQGLPARERRRSLRREAGLATFTANALWWAATRSYLATVHRLRVVGREHLPVAPPFLIVANHSSHLDALILGGALPARHLGRVFPIAAGDTFFENAAIASFASACMNALPIWRQQSGRHSLDELRRRLVEEGCIYILFPEGTRTRTGLVATFKPGFGRLVCESKVPVVPCHIAGAWESLPPGRRVPRASALQLTIGLPLVFVALPNSREGWVNAAATAEAAVKRLASDHA